ASARRWRRSAMSASDDCLCRAASFLRTASFPRFAVFALFALLRRTVLRLAAFCFPAGRLRLHFPVQNCSIPHDESAVVCCRGERPTLAVCGYLVVRFRSSPALAARSDANFGIEDH